MFGRGETAESVEIEMVSEDDEQKHAQTGRVKEGEGRTGNERRAGGGEGKEKQVEQQTGSGSLRL